MVAAILVWGWLGLIAHYRTFAKPYNDHHPVGYVLSVFPGPLVWLINADL